MTSETLIEMMRGFQQAYFNPSSVVENIHYFQRIFSGEGEMQEKFRSENQILRQKHFSNQNLDFALGDQLE